MISAPTLQTLQFDCVLQILRYVPLPECMFLRSSSRHLKDAVDEHFRCEVQTLSVLLSGRYSLEAMAIYEQYYVRLRYNEEKISFGSTSGVSQRKLWQNKDTSIDPKGYFRSENYLVLFDLAKFGQFVKFIANYLPRITKLALLIDHNDHFYQYNVPKVLNTYGKSLKVLLLDRTERSMIDKYSPYSILDRVTYKNIHLSFRIYNSIDGLEALEELYFFTSKNHSVEIDRKTFKFINNMLGKLRVMHILLDPHVDEPQVFGKLEELACFSTNVFYNQMASYPQLKKSFFFGPVGMVRYPTPIVLPNLREIHFFNIGFGIDENMMKMLNYCPKLERIRCRHMWRSREIPVGLINRTVKLIEIDRLKNEPVFYSWETNEKALKELKESFVVFRSLEKVIIREPFMKLTGSDIWN